MDDVKFHFDPGCPWCYQTSRWAKRLEVLGEIKLDWGVFSLGIVNAAQDADLRTLEPRSAPAVRTVIGIRENGYPELVGPFYSALGKRIWEKSPPEDDWVKATTESLTEIGLDPDLCTRALSDPSTWDAVIAEHNELIERTRSFGVPTIVLDGGKGPAIFGPVISALPNDEDAVELWRHVSWLARYENFSELKRDRVTQPDLPGETWRREHRASDAQRHT